MARGNKKGTKPPVTFADMDKEKLKAVCSKGGKTTAERAKARKSFKQIMETMMDLPLRSGDIVNELNSLEEVKTLNIDVKTAVVYAQIKQALKGNQQSFTIIMQLLGEMNSGNPNMDKLDQLLLEVKEEVSKKQSVIY